MNPIKWSANSTTPFDPLRSYAAQTNAIQPRQRVVTMGKPISVERSKGMDTKLKYMAEDRADARMREQQDRLDNRSAIEFGQNMARDSIRYGREQELADTKYRREKELLEESQKVQEKLQDRQLNIDLERDEYIRNSPDEVLKREQNSAYHKARMAEIHFKTMLDMDTLQKQGTAAEMQAQLGKYADEYLLRIQELKESMEADMTAEMFRVEEDNFDFGTGLRDNDAKDIIKDELEDGTIPSIIIGDTKLDEESFDEILSKVKSQGMYTDEAGRRVPTDYNMLMKHIMTYSDKLGSRAEMFMSGPQAQRTQQEIEALTKAAQDMRRLSGGMTEQNAQNRIKEIQNLLKSLKPVVAPLLRDAQASSFGAPPQVEPPSPPSGQAAPPPPPSDPSQYFNNPNIPDLGNVYDGNNTNPVNPDGNQTDPESGLPDLPSPIRKQLRSKRPSRRP